MGSRETVGTGCVPELSNSTDQPSDAGVPAYGVGVVTLRNRGNCAQLSPCRGNELDGDGRARRKIEDACQALRILFQCWRCSSNRQDGVAAL